MNTLVMIHEAGIPMSDGRYVATLEQIELLINMARKGATCSKGENARNSSKRAYEWMVANGGTQEQAVAEFGISQAALSRYIKRHGLTVVDNRRTRGARCVSSMVGTSKR